MNANPNGRTKHLSIVAAILIAIAVVAWVSPPTAEAEDAPAVSIRWVVASAQAISDVHANIPTGPIQDGQWCQAYGVVHVGSPPYHFEWSGQFSGIGQQGPLGPNQIINGYIDGNGPHWLRVDVWDDETKENYIGWGQTELDIDEEYEYNPDCEV